MLREMGDLDCITNIWKRSFEHVNQHMIDARIKAKAMEKLGSLPKYTHHVDWAKYT